MAGALIQAAYGRESAVFIKMLAQHVTCCSASFLLSRDALPCWPLGVFVKVGHEPHSLIAAFNLAKLLQGRPQMITGGVNHDPGKTACVAHTPVCRTRRNFQEFLHSLFGSGMSFSQDQFRISFSAMAAWEGSSRELC
jgi:hypothetical protein